MKKAIPLALVFVLVLSACARKSEPVEACAGADFFTIINAFEETPHTVDDPDTVNAVVQMYNTFEITPDRQTMDFFTMYTLVFYKDGEQVLSFTIDKGYIAFGAITEKHYKITSAFDYSLIKSAYDAVALPDG